MASNPPAPTNVPDKHLMARNVLRHWKKLREVMGNATQRGRIIKSWTGANKNKRARRLRQAWEKIPARHHPDFEGILPWRPHHGNKPTMDELKRPAIDKAEDWRPPNLNRDKVFWSSYNVDDLATHPGPLLELLFSRADRNPYEFFDSDIADPFDHFKKMYWPDAYDDAGEVFVWMKFDDPENEYRTYGDIHRAYNREQALQCEADGLRQLGEGEIAMEIQQHVYDFLAKMCKTIIGDTDFAAVPALPAGVAATFGDPTQWRPTLAAGDEDDDVRVQRYLRDSASLQIYTNSEEINWEWLKRLADSERVKARTALLALREDPGVFKNTLEETFALQPERMESNYQDANSDWRRNRNRDFEFRPTHREIRKLRDNIMCAVNRYEGWCHVFRLIIQIEARWDEYEDTRRDSGHLHQEFEINFKTLYRMLNLLQLGLEVRNCTSEHIVSTEPRFQQYFNRSPWAGMGPDEGRILEDDGSRKRRRWPEGEDFVSQNLTEMLSRISAFTTRLGTYTVSSKLLAEELQKCSDDTGLALSPFIREHLRSRIVFGLFEIEFRRFSWLKPLFTHIESKEGTVEFLLRASELNARTQALKSVKYEGHAYETSPWGRLLPSMRVAIDFERYFPPDRVRPLNEPASIRAENNLAAFWQQFDTIVKPAAGGLPMYTQTLFDEAQPLRTIPTPPGKKAAPAPAPAPPPPPPRQPRRTYAERLNEARVANPAQGAGREADAQQQKDDATEQAKLERVTQDTEQNPIPITNRRVWELIDILFGEVDPATMQQRITWDEIKRMLQHIGYDVAFKGQGSICTITPLADLQTRGFTTTLTYHRPHDGIFVGFQARQWANNRVHGLVTKGWTFKCFQNRVGGAGG